MQNLLNLAKIKKSCGWQDLIFGKIAEDLICSKSGRVVASYVFTAFPRYYHVANA